MFYASLMDTVRLWFSAAYIESTLGYALAIICAVFLLTELYTYITQKSEPDLMMFLLAGIIGGVLQGVFKDPLLAILAGLCWLMIYSVWTIRESPVWRELMLASLISYLFVLAGRAFQVVLNFYIALKGYDQATFTILGLTGQQYFGIAWNFFIYIFFIMCIIFFGKRFFLVSRLTSPQVIYLLLFAVSYFILFRFEKQLNFYFAAVPIAVADRLLFASFGTYEIMILTNFLLYFISGPLLHLIFGVKKVKDERVLNLVEEVRSKLGVKTKVRVGRVKAPILNAFAFGAFFDKRIAFMSNELDDFTDDDIRGIAGHELAHAQEAHTFWLFIITTFTFAITKALNLPATSFDYIFDPDVGLDFLWYYLYNIAIMAVSYLFVRMLEGRADMRTMKAGFGRPLAKSLVRLDGFYQGIASEMGLSVYLLTDKKQSKAEKIRFLGDSGRNMYDAHVQPSTLECFINLLASHPKTAFRVAALSDSKKISPVKAALLPLLLLIPFVRTKFLRELRESRESSAEVINETFAIARGKNGVSDYSTLSHLKYQFDYLVKRDVVAISRIDKKEFYEGKVEKISLTENVTSPLILTLKTNKGTKELSISDFKVFELAVGQKQLFKNGKVGVITDIGTSDKKFAFKVNYLDTEDSEPKELTIPGISLDYLHSIVGKDIIFTQKGVTRLAHLDAAEISDAGLKESTFTISMGEITKEISGDKFILEFKPFDIYIKKGKEEQQQSLFDALVGKPVSFLTKDDLDSLVKGTVKAVDEEKVILSVLDEEREVKKSRIEFIYLYEDSASFLYKSSASLIDRLLMRWSNRNKLAYVFP